MLSYNDLLLNCWILTGPNNTQDHLFSEWPAHLTEPPQTGLMSVMTPASILPPPWTPYRSFLCRDMERFITTIHMRRCAYTGCLKTARVKLDITYYFPRQDEMLRRASHIWHRLAYQSSWPEIKGYDQDGYLKPLWWIIKAKWSIILKSMRGSECSTTECIKDIEASCSFAVCLNHSVCIYLKAVNKVKKV